MSFVLPKHSTRICANVRCSRPRSDPGSSTFILNRSSRGLPLATGPASRCPIVLRPSYRNFSSTSSLPLRLAYDLHPASKPTTAPTPTSDNGGDKRSPIVFIHGLFGNKKNNRSMSKVLARDLDRDVYAIDLRNHGDSPHDPRHEYTVLAQDVEEFIQEHNLGSVTLIGHSMGAKTAMTLALSKPSLVKNLIPVDNAPVDAALKSYFGKYLQGMRKVDEAKIKKQSEADEILKGFEESLPIRQFLLTNLIRAPSNNHQTFRIPLGILAQSLDAMADFPFKSPETDRFVGPTLFVRGTKSHYLADETLPAVGSFFPKFELRDVEGGHWVISENPSAFREVVVEFLADKD